jgi:hypothetical protein
MTRILTWSKTQSMILFPAALSVAKMRKYIGEPFAFVI